MPVDARPALTGSMRRADDNALWLMSLADLMLVLLAFFVLLAAADPSMSQTDAPAPAALPDDRNPVQKAPAPPAARESSDDSAALHRAPARPRHAPADLIQSFMVKSGHTPPIGRLASLAGPALRRPADPGVPRQDALGPRQIREEPRGAAAPIQPAPEPTLRREVAEPAATSDAHEHALGAAEAKLREIFRSAGDHAEISPGSDAVTVRLRDTITFASGSADLLPGVRPLLGRVAGWLETHPEIELEISGHTDDVPIATPRYPSNWELSAARAAAVARELLDRSTIDPRRTHIAAYGQHRPLAPHQGQADDRARNRRVEIRFALPVNPTS